jgi:hypothetical protein
LATILPIPDMYDKSSVDAEFKFAPT